MLQPVQLADFFTVFFSAALVIMFGALYALLFAYAKVKQMPRLIPLAYTAYLGLFTSVLVLARAAHLSDPFWIAVVLLMLVGYLVAPQAIWRLCVATHVLEHAAEESLIPVFSTTVRPKRGEHHD